MPSFYENLKEYQSQEWLTYVQIMAGDRGDLSQCCPYCRSNHMAIFEKFEAPIMPRHCTAANGCRCTVVAIIDEALPADFQHKSKNVDAAAGESPRPWWQFWK